jgi:hypothetical protein
MRPTSAARTRRQILSRAPAVIRSAPGLVDCRLEKGPSGAHIGRMAREKYESLLRCPMCERTGLAEMSDDKSTKIGDYDTRVEAVTQGFEIRGKDVICSECQVSAL